MIAIDVANLLRDRIASEIEVEAVSKDQLVIYMPFVFEDGDHCSIYLSRLKGDRWKLSDEGDIIKRASFSGADSNPAFASRLKSITDFYGAEERNGTLNMSVSDDDVGDAVFTLTQTFLEASWLSKASTLAAATVESRKFPQRLAKLVTSAVDPEKVRANWHDPVSDPHGVYKVDYRIEGKRRQLLLFGVWGPNSCMRATIACQHYRMANFDFDGVAIYRNEEKMSKVYTEPLNAVVSKHFPRIVESKTIKRFLTSAAA